jgi:hypothetical protein
MSFKYLNKDQDIFDGDDGEDVYASSCARLKAVNAFSQASAPL